ncbi:ABC transporter permease [Chloroflexota bacterium]
MLIFMLTLPLMFVNNALYPLPALPAWMRFVAQINPMSYVVDGLRQTVFISSTVVTGGTPLELWLCYLVVITFAAFGMGLAYMSFKMKT